jgi:hypothetical protein
VLGSLSAHVETVETVGLSGDFNFGASGAIDGKLVVWDLNTLAQRSVAQHDKAVSMLQWIPGTACLYRCEKNFCRWVVFSRGAVGFFSRTATQRKGLARLTVPARRWTQVCETRTPDTPTVHRGSAVRE